jgi:hypothetical protein
MLGIFNADNFDVCRGSESFYLSKLANIPLSEFQYGKKIQGSGKPLSIFMESIYSSFGNPSYILSGAADGPVYCWIISSHSKASIIYIEFWRHASPERMYIFANDINIITSSFLEVLYKSSI